MAKAAGTRKTTATNKKRRAMDQRLAAAEKYCEERGERLTQQRKDVLALLLNHTGCVKAYDLLAELRATYPQAQPPTIYRPLKFLMDLGLVHRVESQNAYVACDLDEYAHHDLLVVCPRCTTVAEVADEAVSALLRARLQDSGFELQDATLEISALCGACAKTQGGATHHHHSH